MIMETERLFLREMTWEDYPAICEILQDEKTMYAQKMRVHRLSLIHI